MAGAGAGCRCCLNNAVLKDIATEYYWMGDREVYAEMLHECFNIKLSQLGTHRGICDACIFRLRDAICFKRQVLSSEEQTLRHLVKQAIPKIKNEDTVVFKVERPDTSDSEDNIEDNVDDAHMDIEILDEVKGELNMDPKTDEMRKINVELSPKPTAQQPRALKRIHKRPAKVVERNATEQPGPSTSKKSRATSFAKTGSGVTIGDTTIKPLKASAKSLNAKERTTAKQQEHKVAALFLKQPQILPERLKSKVNASAIVKFSNVTPFRDKNRDGYTCFYCDKPFSDPDDLRKHTHIEHILDKVDYFKKNTENEIKVDITSMCCSECAREIPDLKTLKEHLVSEHNKNIFNNIQDLIIPFKLTKQGPLLCTECKQSFETYKMLHQHMNSHYRNFVCAQCGAGFVSFRRLKFHEARHLAGEFKCEECQKVFQSRSKLNFHVKGVHRGDWQRNKCPHCPEKFSDYYKKQKHLVDVHNHEKIDYRCQACNQEFSNKIRLSIHTRKYHLQELNVECSICNKKFFGRKDLTRHMDRHSTERHECSVCNKLFASKRTLSVHKRIHRDDRRYGCHICGKTFIQKSSMTSHMRSHHPEQAENMFLNTQSVMGHYIPPA